MITKIDHGAAHKYEVVPTMKNCIRWALLSRIHPFSRRLWWGDHVIGWPEARLKTREAETELKRWTNA